MLRTALGVIAGFFCWLFLWLGSERILSAIWSAFGAHQTAFQAAIENGGAFTPDATMLFTHIVLAAIASISSGYLAALIAGENRRAPLILGLLLIALGLLKAAASWQYVPIWYHITFTATLLPMAVLGGKLKAAGK